MADGNSGSSGGGPKPKTRNPIERVLVWGVIGILLLVLANEGWSRIAYSHATTTLSKKMKFVDDNPEAPPLTAADVRDAVRGKQPARKVDLSGKMVTNGAGSFEEYDWFTIHPTNKLKLFVYYGHQGAKEKGEPDVITFSSEEEPVLEFKPLTKEEIAELQKQAEQNPPPQMGAMIGPGMMGGPPGRGGPPGGRGGRPGRGGPPVHDAEQPSGGQAAAATTDKPADEKPAADEAAEKAQENASGDKPTEAKSEEAKPDSDHN